MTQLTATIDPETLARRARDALGGGRGPAARPLVAALERMSPHHAALPELEARLLALEERLPEALEAMDRAVVAAPRRGDLLLGRAELRLRADDIEGAACDAADAVMLDPASPRAKATLGAILLELGQIEDATVCLAQAVRAEPKREAFRLALAQAQERGGDATLAAATLELGIAELPGSVGLRTAAIMLAMRKRDFAGAAALAEAARAVGVADACVFGLLGHARSSLGDHAGAAVAYAQAHKLAPEDPYVRHLVSAAGILPGAPRAPADYVRTVFDGYADRFERHLLELGYRVPGLVRAAVQERLARGGPTGPVLDLGCGTGLVGVVLSDLPLGPMTGVDLSPAMLARAAEKGTYAALVEADVETVLERSDTPWALVVAADVFCYFGALDTVLARCRARLAPGGAMVFSVETLGEDGPAAPWRLGRLGRYAHATSYVHDAAQAAGLRVVACRSETLRFEAGADVAGALFVLEGDDHAA